MFLVSSTCLGNELYSVSFPKLSLIDYWPELLITTIFHDFWLWFRSTAILVLPPPSRIKRNNSWMAHFSTKRQTKTTNKVSIRRTGFQSSRLLFGLNEYWFLITNWFPRRHFASANNWDSIWISETVPPMVCPFGAHQQSNRAVYILDMYAFWMSLKRAWPVRALKALFF